MNFAGRLNTEFTKNYCHWAKSGDGEYYLHGADKSGDPEKFWGKY